MTVFIGGLPPEHIQINKSGSMYTCMICSHSLSIVEDGKTDLDQCKINWINKHLHGITESKESFILGDFAIARIEDTLYNNHLVQSEERKQTLEALYELEEYAELGGFNVQPPRFGHTDWGYMTVDEIVEKFGDELSDEQIQHLRDVNKKIAINPEDLKISLDFLNRKS